jgi:hypothetical protein
MRMMMLSGLFALGLGLVGTTGAPAATSGTGLDQGPHASSLLEKTALICRRIRVCHHVRGVRVCHWERVCRRVW